MTARSEAEVPGVGRGDRLARIDRGQVAAVAAGTAHAACGIGLMATSGWLITTASLRPPVLTLAVAMAAVQAFALGRGVFRYLERLSAHGSALDRLGRDRVALFDTLEPLVPGGLPRGGKGSVAAAFVGDTEVVARGHVQVTVAAVEGTAAVVIGTILVGALCPAAGLTVVAGVAVALMAGLAVYRVGWDTADREAELRSELSSLATDVLRSSRELIAYGRRDLVDHQLQEIGQASDAAALRLALVGGTGRAAVNLTTGLTLVTATASALAASRSDRISGVTVAVIVFVTMAAMDALGAMPAALEDRGRARAASRRLAALQTRPRPAGAEVIVAHPAREALAPRMRPSARLRCVSVTGSSGERILDDVSLDIQPGLRVALTGPSGSGKSTAVNAIMHFVACRSGRAEIGDRSVEEMTRAELADQAGWMSDEAHIFATTLRDNLRVGRPSVSDPGCREVLRRVGLDAWYRTLPQGLDTVLGAGGRPTSAGERQRLGLARVLLGRAEVLLLDEPTAHLDPATSGAVLDELLGAAGDRTVLVVSHEANVARHVDQVVTLGGGRVVAHSSGPVAGP